MGFDDFSMEINENDGFCLYHGNERQSAPFLKLKFYECLKNRMYGHRVCHSGLIREGISVITTIAGPGSGTQQLRSSALEFIGLSSVDTIPLNSHYLVLNSIPNHPKYLIFHFCRCLSAIFFESQNWNQKKTKYVWNS